MRRPCGSEKQMEGFERITGFREEPYERTRSRPSVSTDGCGLASLALEAAYEATSWPQRSTDRVSETEPSTSRTGAEAPSATTRTGSMRPCGRHWSAAGIPRSTFAW